MSAWNVNRDGNDNLLRGGFVIVCAVNQNLLLRSAHPRAEFLCKFTKHVYLRLCSTAPAPDELQNWPVSQFFKNMMIVFNLHWRSVRANDVVTIMTTSEKRIHNLLNMHLCRFSFHKKQENKQNNKMELTLMLTANSHICYQKNQCSKMKIGLYHFEIKMIT